MNSLPTALVGPRDQTQVSGLAWQTPLPTSKFWLNCPGAKPDTGMFGMTSRVYNEQPQLQTSVLRGLPPKPGPDYFLEATDPSAKTPKQFPIKDNRLVT